MGNSSNWKLIYRGSRDGFGAENFHARCDHVPNTLLLVRSVSSWIFGGYSSVSRDQSYEIRSDPSAYLFSLTNRANKSLKFTGDSRATIYNNPWSGPIFGRDRYENQYLFISGNSNENMHSFAHYAYDSPFRNEQTLDINTKDLFDGGKHFKVSDVEVYSRIDLF